MTKRLYSTVLMDAGGVLLDENEYEALTCRLIVKVLQKYLGTYSEANYWKDLDESIRAFSPHNRQYIIWKYCNGEVYLFYALWKEFMDLWNQEEHELKLMLGIIGELESLRKKFKIILAGQYGEELIAVLKKEHVIKLFENEMTQDDFYITKPDPRYVEQICRAAGVKPQECIMIGDRIDKDIIPAKQNKMGTVLVMAGVYKNQKPRTVDEIPDMVVEGIIGLGKKVRENFS